MLRIMGKTLRGGSMILGLNSDHPTIGYMRRMATCAEVSITINYTITPP